MEEIINIGKLKMIFFIQEYTKLKQNDGVPNTRIVFNLNKFYNLSYRSFYNYIEMPVRVLLKKANVNPESLEEQKNDFINLINKYETNVSNSIQSYKTTNRE